MRPPSDSTFSAQTSTQAGASVIYVHSRAGLSGRGRMLVLAIATLLLVACGVVLAAADALPITGGRAQNGAAITQSATSGVSGASQPSAGELNTAVVRNGTANSVTEIAAEWGGPAIHLDWTNAEYARAEATFIGDRIATPGDRVVRTLNVVNAGPRDGIAKVTIDVFEQAAWGALNPELADDVTLFWNVQGVSGEESFATLLPGERVAIAEIAVPRGGAIDVTVGFAVGSDVETSRSRGVESNLLSFDVGVEMHGNTEPPVAPPLAWTGVTGILALIGIAGALLLLGWLLFVARKRKVCDECDSVIRRGEPWVEHRSANEPTRRYCESCHLQAAAAAP